MRQQILAFQAELLKLRHSGIVRATFIAFAIAPLMGGVFMLIMRSPGALANAGGLSAKAQAMHFSANWPSYFSILIQAIGVGGVLIFGFVASWLFGREYSDGTAKDLMALPISRTRILNAKFVVYFCWCSALAISNLLIGALIGWLVHLPAVPLATVTDHLATYSLTFLLTLLPGTPVAYFAIKGRGYLAPLGFVALALVGAQVIAATGYGCYFPWSVLGLFSGAAGAYKDQLNIVSYLILLLTAVAGYLATVAHWKYADHSK